MNNSSNNGLLSMPFYNAIDKNRPLRWDYFQFDDPVLLASGDDFSAEKILDKTFLTEAQRTLNAKEIVISIPRRRCMMIVDRHCTKETLDKFIQLHGIAWNEDNYGNAPIFNGLFLAKDGQAQEVIWLNKTR